VERCDFRSSFGFGDGHGHRERLGLRGGGPRLIITDLGVLEPDPESCQLVQTQIHPGVTVEQCIENTGWQLRVADNLVVTEPISDREIAALRTLQAA
jgi:glutaconate CoA-transferase subunit B